MPVYKSVRQVIVNSVRGLKERYTGGCGQVTVLNQRLSLKIVFGRSIKQIPVALKVHAKNIS